MSSFRIPVILSLSFHVMIFGIITLLLKRTVQPPPSSTLSVFISTGEEINKIAGEIEKAKEPESSADLRTINVKKSEPDQPTISSNVKTDNTVDEAWTTFLQEGEARVALMRQDIKNDGAQKKQNAFTKPAMGPLRIGKPAFGGRDPVADGIYKRNVGSQPFLMNLTSLVEEEEKKSHSPPSLDFLPTKTQLRCLSCLMDADSLSDTQLYPLLGMDENGTFESYQENVEELTQKGLLTRKRVSPRQIFSLFGIPIEMSAKNRRNPEFLYKPNIDRKSLLIFLEARLYDVKEQLKENPGDSIRIQTQLNSLMEKLSLVRPVSD